MERWARCRETAKVVYDGTKSAYVAIEKEKVAGYIYRVYFIDMETGETNTVGCRSLSNVFCRLMDNGVPVERTAELVTQLTQDSVRSAKTKKFEGEKEVARKKLAEYRRNNPPYFWRDADGNIQEISTLNDAYIQNILNMLTSRGLIAMGKKDLVEGQPCYMIDILCEEKARRALARKYNLTDMI